MTSGAATCWGWGEDDDKMTMKIMMMMTMKIMTMTMKKMMKVMRLSVSCCCQLIPAGPAVQHAVPSAPAVASSPQALLTNE